jgi:hypothetical protein
MTTPNDKHITEAEEELSPYTEKKHEEDFDEHKPGEEDYKRRM